MSLRVPLALSALCLLAACGGGGGAPTPGVVSTTLAAPTHLTVGANGTRKVVLAWYPPPQSVDGYIVEIQQGTGAFAPITPNPISATNLLYTFDPSVPEDTDFGFRVYAVKGSAHTNYTPVQTYHLGLNPPSQPTATYDIDAGGVRVEWASNTLVGDGVRVERSTCDYLGNDTGPWESLPTLGPDAVSTLDQTAPDTTRVHYRVISLKGAEESIPSSLSAPLLPGFNGPANIWLDYGNGQVNLSWSSPTLPMDGIQIERRQTDDSGLPVNDWSVVASLAPSYVSWTDANWIELADSQYRVRYLHGSTMSRPTTSIYEFLGLKPPIGLLFTQIQGGLRLSWTNQSQAATQIKILRTPGAETNPSATITTLSPSTNSFDDVLLPAFGYYSYKVVVESGAYSSATDFIAAAPADPPGALTLTPEALSLPDSTQTLRAALRPDGTWIIWTQQNALLSLAQAWPAYTPAGYQSYVSNMHVESDALGNPHLMFLLNDPLVSGQLDLTHDWFDGTTWNRETLATTTSYTNDFSAVLDSTGMPQALLHYHVDGVGDRPALIRKLNGTWTASTLSDLGVSSPGYSSTFSLSLDPSGKAHMLFDFTGDLHEVGEDTSGSWSDTLLAASSIQGPLEGNWAGTSAEVLARDVDGAFVSFAKSGGAWSGPTTVAQGTYDPNPMWTGHSSDGTRFAMVVGSQLGIKVYHVDPQGAWHQTLIRVPPDLYPVPIRLGFDANGKLHVLITSSINGGATDFHE